MKLTDAVVRASAGVALHCPPVVYHGSVANLLQALKEVDTLHILSLQPEPLSALQLYDLCLLARSKFELDAVRSIFVT